MAEHQAAGRKIAGCYSPFTTHNHNPRGDNKMSQLQQAAAADKPKRLSLQALVQKLASISAVDEADLQIIELKAGEVLFRQDDPGDGMYVLVAGMLGVRRRNEAGEEAEIDKLAPGAMVGELALLSGQKRTATVYAVNDCGLLRLTKEE
jgi:CRP-like cAMP-binding protein